MIINKYEIKNILGQGKFGVDTYHPIPILNSTVYKSNIYNRPLKI
jgi:hypothetical protein